MSESDGKNSGSRDGVRRGADVLDVFDEERGRVERRGCRLVVEVAETLLVGVTDA